MQGGRCREKGTGRREQGAESRDRTEAKPLNLYYLWTLKIEIQYELKIPINRCEFHESVLQGPITFNQKC